MRFRNIDLRCVEIDGEPWFVTADVCAALELSGNPSQHTNRLGKAECQLIFRTKNTRHLFSPKAPYVSIISESGLYKLIMRSTKPEAKDFQHWVTAVVLPAIRKDGTTPDDFCEKSVSHFV